jgi:short subunit dehydrogenase-like uncharacterized protein
MSAASASGSGSDSGSDSGSASGAASASGSVIIAVYGASGTTGALVAAELARRGQHVRLVGRERTRLQTVATDLAARDRKAPAAEVAVAAAHDAAGLRAAFAGCAVVVACAGPFTRIGGPVIQAALDAGAHYVDVCSEQAFLRACFEEHESAARHRGRVVVNGVGFESALGDWAARWAAAALCGVEDEDAPVARAPIVRIADDRPLDEVVIAYAVDGFVPTHGTQRSLVASLTGPGVVWTAGRWDPVRPGARRRDINFGAGIGSRGALSFPSGEVITVPRHVAARRVETLLAPSAQRWITAGLGLAAPLLGMVRGPLPGWLDGLTDPARSPDPVRRSAAKFAVVAQARRGFERTQVTIAGHDVYAVTAHLAASAAARLAMRGAGPVGVLAPSEVFPAAASLDALDAYGDITLTTSFER